MPLWLWFALCVVVHACVFTSNAVAQNCVIYSERFDSFSGPADFNDGTFKAQWCLNNASVASSSFCPGGNALRLDGNADDPILWVFAGSAGCTAITIEFDYSQFQNTGTVLRYAATSDAAKNCNRTISQTAGALTATGGVCTHATHTIALGAGQSVYWKFDHGANSNAVFIDNITVRATGCCGGEGAHGCCELGGAGCSDNAIKTCVCAIDPFCCEVEWDAICVDEVESLNCGSCAPVVEYIDSFATNFGTLYQTGGVCSRFPELFERCEGNGPYLTISTACGGSGDVAMSFGSGFPYSAAITHCIDLTTAASARLEFNYTKNTGTLGPRIDISTDGETFSTLWTAPVAFAGGCQGIAIDLTAFAGDPAVPGVQFRFASGSSTTNGASIDDIVLNTSATANHDCCETGSAGCVDPNISACVCAIDPFCCEVEWDDLCVISVEFYQCGDCGFCVEQFDANFGNAFVGGSVCDVFPDLFILCDGTGPWLTTGTVCGAINDPALIFISGTQTSAVTTRCLNLTNIATASIEFSYSVNQNGIAPSLDISLDAGGTYAPLWRAPAGVGSGCHDACADLSPHVGHPFVLLRFAAAGPSAGGSTIDDIHLRRGSVCPPPSPPPDPKPKRPEDIDGSGTVDVLDLFVVLSEWGNCPKKSPPVSCSGDITGDGIVDVFDLFMLLNAWGG